ncbi:MAG: flagellar biosynthetic protein FliO [Chlamydiae bacterium]|nr:flagellar biosynthetic protein FliO [Chlamydiota bacterium]
MKIFVYLTLLTLYLTYPTVCIGAVNESQPAQSSILSSAQSGNKQEENPTTQDNPAEDNKVPLHIPMSDEIKMPSYEGTFGKMLLTLGGLLLLVFLTVWLLKKLTQGKIGAFGKKHISVIERRPLSPKTVLYLVELEGKQILIAESQLEVTSLATMETPTES